MNDIKKILITGNVEKVENTIYGVKYVVSGKLNTPSGKIAKIVTVWIIKNDENIPRFVTAYPGVKR